MFWMRRKPSNQRPARPSDPGEEVVDEPVSVCCMCGRELGFDPDDALDTEGPGRHLCGNCYRSREQDSLEAFQDGF